MVFALGCKGVSVPEEGCLKFKAIPACYFFIHIRSFNEDHNR
jgi:hypothetical protein